MPVDNEYKCKLVAVNDKGEVFEMPDEIPTITADNIVGIDEAFTNDCTGTIQLKIKQSKLFLKNLLGLHSPIKKSHLNKRKLCKFSKIICKFSKIS